MTGAMIPPAGEGVPLLNVTIALLVVCCATVAGRLSVRRWLKPEAMGLDDYLMVAGLILYGITCALVIACAFHGAGQYSKYLTTPTIMQGTKIFYIAEFFYAACTVPIKGSICVCLVRIADARRRFVWSLWGLVALQTLAAIIFIITIGNICHPVTAMWGETAGVCNANLNSHISFFFSGVSILTDLMLAILPALLLWPIQMKRRLKFSVVIILGMAAFASCATIIRLRYLTLYNNQAEFMYSAGPIGLWSVIEEGIGIIAGSLPALRPILSLPFLGGTCNSSFPSKGAHSQDLDALPWRDDADEEHGRVRLNVLAAGPLAVGEAQAQAQASAKDSDGESQVRILKETRVTVSTGPSSPVVAEQWKWRRVNGWERADGEP